MKMNINNNLKFINSFFTKLCDYDFYEFMLQNKINFDKF